MQKSTGIFSDIKQSVFDIAPQALIKQMSGLFTVVDLNSKFIAANHTTLKWSGFKSLDAMIGFSYMDMRCKASNQHDIFVNQDRIVIEKNAPIKILGRYCYHGDEWKILFGEKYLLKDKNEVPIAIALHFHDIKNYHILDFSRFLNMVESTQPNKFYEQQVGYILEEGYTEINLTKRQAECMFFVLRGKTLKEIAKTLNLSPRTVEMHVEEIKNRLNCSKKSELIHVRLYEYCSKQHYFKIHLTTTVARPTAFDCAASGVRNTIFGNALGEIF